MIESDHSPPSTNGHETPEPNEIERAFRWDKIWGVEPKIGGNTPKMDGVYKGKPYFLMDDLGGKPTIFGNIHVEQKLLVCFQCLTVKTLVYFHGRDHLLCQDLPFKKQSLKNLKIIQEKPADIHLGREHRMKLE